MTRLTGTRILRAVDMARVVDGRNERNSSTTDAVWWNKVQVGTSA